MTFQQPPDLRAIATEQRSLERRCAGEGGGRLVGGDELVLVGGQGRAELGLQPCVDAPSLAARCHRRESEERSCQRQQRQQHEIRDELDFETSHDFPSSPTP
jgi:hypothetical protein